MSRLMHHNTSIVPAMPMTDSVHPNVQMSISLFSSKTAAVCLLRAGLFDFSEQLICFDGLSG
jgi:hypothetical protein